MLGNGGGISNKNEAIIDNVLSVSPKESVMGILLTFFQKNLKFPVVKNDCTENLRKDSPDIFRKGYIILVIHKIL